MRRSLFLLLFILGLLLAAFLAVVGSFRSTGEPWQLEFVGEGNQLTLAIACTKPPIPRTNVILEGELENPIHSQVMMITDTVTLPIGQITFTDLTTLPGRVTLSLFDHEIDIMQRGLIIDKIEYEWGKTVTIQ